MPPPTGRGRGWRDATRRAAPFRAVIPRRHSLKHLRLSFRELRFDAGVHIINVALGIDDHETRGLGDSECQVTLANALMKSQFLRFEATLVMYGIGVARTRAREPDVFRQVEE